MRTHVSVGVTLGTVFALALAWVPSAIAAGGVVGTGTPGSCTEVAFDAVFFNAQATGGGTITFNCGAAPHVIVFRAYKPVSTNTQISGGDRITLSGNGSSALFQVFASGTLTLGNLTVTRGYGPSGAIENFGSLIVNNSRLERNESTANGGAIVNHGNLMVTNAVIADNTAAKLGGGIHADGGETTIVGSRFANNSAKTGGGGMAITAGTRATINTSDFFGNSTGTLEAEGGGIRSEGTLTITDSMLRRNYGGGRGGALAVIFGVATVFSTVVVGNDAEFGGGIRQRGGTLNLTDVTLAGNGYDRNGLRSALIGGGFSQDGGASRLNNVTVSGNWASTGGGLDHSNGTTILTNVTLSGNEAVNGSAIDHLFGSVSLTNVTITGTNAPPSTAVGINNRGGTILLKNTVVAIVGGKSCFAAMPTATFSFSSDASCGFGGGRDNAILPFAPLANNGGLTFTQLPLTGNAAIDNGTDADCTKTDQRGAFRPFGFACDAGAVERILGVQAVVGAVEYFHAAFGHYFVTYITDEIAKLDSAFFEGWVRTGDRFNVYQTADAGRAPVCRFFTLAFPPKSSHFYAPRGLGCEGTLQDSNWTFEGDVFYAPLPAANGDCPNGHKVIYRLYNNGQGGAPNHRFTTNPDVRDQMLAAGYIAEGAGIGVGMCSPI